MRRKIYTILFASIILFSSCNDFLDREDPTIIDDANYWTSEESLRNYDVMFYPYFFSGYNYKSGSEYAPLLGYTFSDDIVYGGNQSNFTTKVPVGSIGSTGLAMSNSWQSQYSGPDWNFAWIRKANVMQDRIEQRMKNILTPDAYTHWMAVAKFYRALEYARLVNVFGDVPYYDREVLNTEKDELYKNRTPRNEVMDAVYDDFKFAITGTNVKADDGVNKVNRYVVATLVSRWALIEGTWQKYHENDHARAAKFLQLAVEAADVVIQSGKYSIGTEYRALFSSNSLIGNREVILSREYSSELGVSHSVATACNLQSPRLTGPNLDLVKAFLCSDGTTYGASTVEDADQFDVENLVKTRDPRFEATFLSRPTYSSKASFLYITKYIPREALEYTSTPATEFTGANNSTAAPVLRYAEVLLNWLEAKAELSEMGLGSVVQSDIDLTVNQIRNRPIAQAAVSKGVSKLANMNLASLPDDPHRDPSVSPLLWEIRRERRIEFFSEHSRIIDLRRWKKLDYMNTESNRDLLYGVWVDISAIDDELFKVPLRVVDAAGNIITYDGTNKTAMKGFWFNPDTKDRLPYLNRPNVNIYLCPMGEGNIVTYQANGYQIDQTKGWAQ